MEINNKPVVTQKTMPSPTVEARADSPLGSRPESKLQVQDTNSESKLSTEVAATNNALHLANKNETTAPVIRTIEQAHKDSTLTFGLMSYGLRKILSVSATVLCAGAAASVVILPENNSIRKLLETWAGHLARLSIGIASGATGAVDAFRDGKPLLAAAQLGDVVTSIMSPIKNMTNYRGLPIGLYNVLPALETIHGKATYANYTDYFTTNWNTLKIIFKDLLKNPFALFDSNKKGELGVVSGAAMSISSLLYMLTGLNIFATARNTLGIAVEAEKVKSIHLEQGRGRYAGSGCAMMAGSAANIVSEYSSGSNSTFWSYINLLLNAVGKERFQAALQANEPAKIGPSLTFTDMLTRNLKNIFSFGKEAEAVLRKAEPILLKKEQQSEVVQKQVQAVSNHNGVSSGARPVIRDRSSISSRRIAAPVMNRVATKAETSLAPARVEASAPVRVEARSPSQVEARGVQASNTSTRQSGLSNGIGGVVATAQQSRPIIKITNQRPQSVQVINNATKQPSFLSSTTVNQ